MGDDDVYSEAFQTHLFDELGSATAVGGSLSDLLGSTRRSHQAARQALHAHFDTNGGPPPGRRRAKRTRLAKADMDRQIVNQSCAHGAFMSALETVGAQADARMVLVEARLDALENP